MSKKRTGVSCSSSLSSAFASSLLFLNFFGIVSFVTTTLDKYHFRSPVRLSQINAVAPIHLKVELYAVLIEWGSRIDFLFVERQYIINYWDFPSKTSRKWLKRLAPKISWHDYWETCVKMSHRDRLVCFADFAGMTLFAVRFVLFLLPLHNCFLKVCLPTLSAALFKFFLLLTTSVFSGSANSNLAPPARFAAGTIYLRKNGIAVFPITCASAPNPVPRCRPIPL